MNNLSYILADRDKSIVFGAKELLRKIVRSTLVSVAQVEQVTRVLAVLNRMPDMSEQLDVRIELTGPVGGLVSMRSGTGVTMKYCWVCG